MKSKLFNLKTQIKNAGNLDLHGIKRAVTHFVMQFLDIFEFRVKNKKIV